MEAQTEENSNEGLAIEAKLAESQADAELEHVHRIAKMDGPDGYRVATESLKELERKSRSLLDRRQALTKPLDESKKRIIALFKPAQDRLDKAIAVLRSAIAKHDAAAQERLRVATDESAKQIAVGNIQAAMAIASQAAAEAEAPAAEGISKRTIWRFEITDEAALPREYLVPDEKRIGQVVRALKQDTKIPGVRVFAETIVAVSSEGDHHD